MHRDFPHPAVVLAVSLVAALAVAVPAGYYLPERLVLVGAVRPYAWSPRWSSRHY